MKSLIIAIAVILALILAMGGLSSLSGSLSDVVISTTTATTTAALKESISPDGSIVVDENLTFFTDVDGIITGDKSDVADYVCGVCYDYIAEEENTRISIGKIINSITNEALICFAFSGLEVGKTYLLNCTFYDLPFDITDFHYRFNSGPFNDFFISELNQLNECSFLFTAQGTEFQLGVIHFPDGASTETLNVYGEVLKNQSLFILREVIE